MSEGTESETNTFAAVLTRWAKKRNENPTIIIDTPGIGDSWNRDDKHIEEIVNGLKVIDEELLKLAARHINQVDSNRKRGSGCKRKKCLP